MNPVIENPPWWIFSFTHSYIYVHVIATIIEYGSVEDWEDAYFKGQVGVEYGWWMVYACLVSFYACAIPTSS